MCDYPGKLTAWLDHELPTDEALEVQLHLRACTECRQRLTRYQRVSNAFSDYCAAAAEAGAKRRKPSGVPVFAVAAAAVLAAALGILFVRTHLHSLPAVPTLAVHPVPPPEVTTPVPEIVPATTRPVHRQHATPAMLPHGENWVPPEPAIQVAIPADAMFPPGAVPEGVNFTAVVSIGPDGSAEQIRFRPRLTGF
jgi:anti-sigma factor RsiW